MSGTTQRRKTLPSVDIDRVLNPIPEDGNPLVGSSLGDLLKTYLESQRRIGIRQFAERANMSRKRLEALLAGEEVTPEEFSALQAVFVAISSRIDKHKAFMERTAGSKELVRRTTNKPTKKRRRTPADGEYDMDSPHYQIADELEFA